MSSTSPIEAPHTPSAPETAPVGYALAAPTSTPEPKAFSVASLVLGIASLAFGYTFIVPIVGLVLGIMALKREPSNSAMSWWGIVLSGLSLLGGVVAIALGVAFLVPIGLAGLFAS